MYPVKTDDIFHASLTALKRTITKFMLSFLGWIWFVGIGYILDLFSLTVKTQGGLQDAEINQINPKSLSKSTSVFSVCITTNGHLKELVGMLKTKWNSKSATRSYWRQNLRFKPITNIYVDSRLLSTVAIMENNPYILEERLQPD